MVRENFKGASYNGCFAVFDGHGGQRAAEYARSNLSLILDRHPEIESNVVGSLNQGKSTRPETVRAQSHQKGLAYRGHSSANRSEERGGRFMLERKGGRSIIPQKVALSDEARYAIGFILATVKELYP